MFSVDKSTKPVDAKVNKVSIKIVDNKIKRVNTTKQLNNKQGIIPKCQEATSGILFEIY